MATPTPTSYKRIAFSWTFGGSGQKNFDLTPEDDADADALTYIGEVVNQQFGQILVHNRDAAATVCVAISPTAALSGSLTGDGWSAVLPLGSLSDSPPTTFSTLKLFASAACIVDIILETFDDRGA